VTQFKVQKDLTWEKQHLLRKNDFSNSRHLPGSQATW